MITVDVNDHAEVYAAGCRVLTDNLGPEAMQTFMRLSRGGKGDSVKAKYNRPPWTDADHEAFMAEAKADSEARKMA